MKAHGLRIKKAVYGAGARREGAGIPEGPGPISGKEKRHILSAFRAFVSPSRWGFCTIQETFLAF